MSCYTKEELENMLEDVVNELDLSGGMIKEHGPIGTAPAELVRRVLALKNKKIQMLKQGFVSAAPPAPTSRAAREAVVAVLQIEKIELEVEATYGECEQKYEKEIQVRIKQLEEVIKWLEAGLKAEGK